MFWKLCKFEWKSSYRMYGMFYAILLICSVLIGMSSLPDVCGEYYYDCIYLPQLYENDVRPPVLFNAYIAGFDLADTDGKGFVRIVMDFLDLRCYYGNGLDYDDSIRCKCSQRCH